jgi:hypothetical protein
MQGYFQGMKLAFFALHQPGGGFETSFRPAGFLSARKKIHTKQHQFSNINNFASNKDILKI